MSFDTTKKILDELRALAQSMVVGITDHKTAAVLTKAPPSGGSVHSPTQPVSTASSIALKGSRSSTSNKSELSSDNIGRPSQTTNDDLASSNLHVDPSQPTPLNVSDVLGSASDSATDQSPADVDGSTYDGVKTLVLFLHSDPERFEQMSRSMWAAEEIATKVASDADDEEDVVSFYRLPSFPFGGGVTDGQERILYHKFCEVLHSSRSPLRSRTIQPLRIDYRDFQDRTFPEALEASATKHWKPQTPMDYVVEVDPEVIFDAAAAKSERRLKLYEQLSATNSAGNTANDFIAMSGTVNLRVIMDPLKTGFEEEKEFPIEKGVVVANRFEILDLLGKATFSRAVRAHDLQQPIYDDQGTLEGYVEVCLKIINNTKEFFDQSLDEIRLLQLINSKKDPDEAHVVRLIDFFYYKEHTFLVTELLSDNLYEYGKFNREQEEEFYFTVPRLRRIAQQVTGALAYIHSLNLMHCDLKPENILFVSHRRCVVKVIDFGSSCFLSDHLSSYIQSRSYRAPEVILGADYDGRIDVWSLGAILVELVTGDVLFSSETVPEMLARIVAVCGRPLPRGMLWEGRHTQEFVNKFGCIYELGNKDRDENAEDSYFVYTPLPLEVDENGAPLSDEELPYAMLRAKLAAHGVVDALFIDFVQQCLTLDHKLRPTSQDLMDHPFLKSNDE